MARQSGKGEEKKREQLEANLTSGQEVSYERAGEGILSLRDVRVAVFPLQSFTFLMEVIHEHSPEMLKYALYDMGYRAGFALMQALGDVSRDKDDAFRALVENYRRMGYGDLEVVSLDLGKPEAVLRGTNLIETAMARESGVYRTPRAASHYTRGMFAGFMSSLLGAEVICEEVKAEFRGDGASEFVILPFQLGGREET
jgi:predicted hydrocarbon binding protein